METFAAASCIYAIPNSIQKTSLFFNQPTKITSSLNQTTQTATLADYVNSKSEVPIFTDYPPGIPTMGLSEDHKFNRGIHLCSINDQWNKLCKDWLKKGFSLQETEQNLFHIKDLEKKLIHAEISIKKDTTNNITNFSFLPIRRYQNENLFPLLFRAEIDEENLGKTLKTYKVQLSQIKTPSILAITDETAQETRIVDDQKAYQDFIKLGTAVLNTPRDKKTN